MLEPIITFFEKLITEFTWRRLIFILTLTFITAGGFIVYETYTGNYRLSRIERSVKLLNDMETLSQKTRDSGNETTTKILKGLTDDLDFFVNHKFTAFSLPPWILKAFAAGAPWALFSLLMLLSGSDGFKPAMLGVSLIAIPSTVIGALLPNFEYPIINFVIYPITSTIIFTSVIMIWQKKKKE